MKLILFFCNVLPNQKGQAQGHFINIAQAQVNLDYQVVG